jgi:hypothetical protein
MLYFPFLTIYCRVLTNVQVGIQKLPSARERSRALKSEVTEQHFILRCSHYLASYFHPWCSYTNIHYALNVHSGTNDFLQDLVSSAPKRSRVLSSAREWVQWQILLSYSCTCTIIPFVHKHSHMHAPLSCYFCK